MSTRSARPAIVTALVLTLAAVFSAAAAADTYKIDPMHTQVVFRIRHMDISNVYGMFTETAGNFTIDPDPAKSSFEAEIKADSIITGQPKRDAHLKGPDFFNVQQFPTITFKSTKVVAADGGYEVTGDLTLHGVTKSVTLKLAGGGEAEMQGQHRKGFTSELEVDRTEFGMTNFPAKMVGHGVALMISFEGIRQ